MKFSCQFRKHHSRTSEMNSLTPVPCLTEIIKKTLFLMLARHQLNIYKLSFEDRLEHLGWRNMIPPVLTSFLILEVGENRKEWCGCAGWAGVGILQGESLFRLTVLFSVVLLPAVKKRYLIAFLLQYQSDIAFQMWNCMCTSMYQASGKPS